MRDSFEEMLINTCDITFRSRLSTLEKIMHLHVSKMGDPMGCDNRESK